MKTFYSTLLLGLALLASTSNAASHFGLPSEAVQVVATIPDLQAIAEAIGGERVKVTSIAKGTMNIHAVPLKPSSLIAVSRAQLFLQMGMSLEHTYVPGLLNRARNPRIQPGEPGFVNCSEGWEPIGVPTSLDRSQGVDLHPLGNPHFNLDPRGGLHIARRVLAGLVAVDPDGEAYYRGRFESFEQRYEEGLLRWRKLGVGWRGKQVLTYHSDFDYLLAFHGIGSLGTIEPKPGVPPTPLYLAELVSRMQREGAKVLLTAPWSNNKSVRFVAQKSGAEVVELPILVGGVPGADTWFAMMDLIHERLALVLGGA